MAAGLFQRPPDLQRHRLPWFPATKDLEGYTVRTRRYKGRPIPRCRRTGIGSPLRRRAVIRLAAARGSERPSLEHPLVEQPASPRPKSAKMAAPKPDLIKRLLAEVLGVAVLYEVRTSSAGHAKNQAIVCSGPLVTLRLADRQHHRRSFRRQKVRAVPRQESSRPP